jgi:hypothetical protein
MSEENKFTCDFCFTKQEDLVNVFCPACGYPMKGSKQEQAQFAAANKKNKEKIDEAETALSQARFAMLWPSLAAFVINFAFDFPPRNMIVFAGTLGFYGIFVAAYFVVSWRPLPILILSAMILFSGMFFAFSNGMVSKILLIVPGVILLIYGNAIYSVWRAEKAVEEMGVFRMKK